MFSLTGKDATCDEFNTFDNAMPICEATDERNEDNSDA